MASSVKQVPKMAPKSALPKGGRIQNSVQQPPANAKALEAEYRDNSEAAAAIKAKAKLLMADMLKTGELELDLDDKEKVEAARERNIAREMQIRNAPKGVRPSARPTDKPVRKSINPREQNVIPNYNPALDYAMNPQNQNYALVSYMGPRNCTPRSDDYCFRIWGVFATKQDATDYTEVIRNTNRYAKFYDIGLMELGCNAPWAPFPPKWDEVEQQEFQNKHIQDFHDARLDAQRKASEHHAQRMENAEDINPEIARQRKIRKTDKKFKQALALRASKLGVTVDQLLENAGDEVFKLKQQAEKQAEAEIDASNIPKQDVTFERRVDEATGNVVTVKKTRKLVKKTNTTTVVQQQ